jgi:tetratricopeptide (TPR) repeat protein
MNQGLEQDHLHLDAQALQAFLLLEKGQVEAAQKQLAQVLQQYPSHQLAALARARALRQSASLQALEAYNRLLALAENSSKLEAALGWKRIEAHRGRYRILQSLGRHDEAREDLTQAERLTAAWVRETNTLLLLPESNTSPHLQAQAPGDKR